jgi:hypothetical protein
MSRKSLPRTQRCRCCSVASWICSKRQKATARGSSFAIAGGCKVADFARSGYATRRVDAPAAEQQHCLAEQAGTALGCLVHTPQLVQPPQKLIHGERHCDLGVSCADEHLKANQPAIAGGRIGWDDDGTMPVQLCQIEHPRLQPGQPLRDALPRDVMLTGDLGQAHPLTRLCDSVEDIARVVGLAGKNIRRQYALTRPATLTAPEQQSGAAVSLEPLQATGHTRRREPNRAATAAATATERKLGGELGHVTASETARVAAMVER